MGDVRVRFAPSPTGYLHVGGARTALFNWLFARKNEGSFILRIEDTDTARSTPEMVERILAGLNWLGLDWDEGPFYQSQRLDLYRERVQTMVRSGAAYLCFCPQGDFAEKRESEDYEKWRYSGACRALSRDEAQQKIAAGESYAVRLKLAPGETTFHDRVCGQVTVKHEYLDDFVLLRSDGMPTYHLACVVDDIDMRISHVIRGADHLSNTPKQILIYQALGKKPPEFAHVPLIMGADKKRLSKRHGATSVEEYQKQGFFAETMRNFLALLGWSDGSNRDIFRLAELVDAFSLDGINPHNAIFDVEKLKWLNGQYINQKTAAELFEPMTAQLIEAGLLDVQFAEQQRDWLLKVFDLFKSRLRLCSDTPEYTDYFFTESYRIDPQAVQKHWKGESGQRLEQLVDDLSALTIWDEASLEACVRQRAAAFGIGAGHLIHPVRVAITGKGVSPGLFEVMVLLGRERVLARIKKAIVTPLSAINNDEKS